MTTNIILAAQGASAGTQSGGGGFGMIIMMVILFAIMYFFMIRPQQKRQKEIRNFQNSVKEGDSIVTASGVYGTVRRINMEKNSLDIEIAKGIVVTIDRNYVYADPSTQLQK